MKVEECLRRFSDLNPNAADLLGISKEQLRNYQERMVRANLTLFFRIADYLHNQGYKVDDYSNLPQENKTMISIILSGSATIEDYLQETNLGRDSFMRNLRGSRLLSAPGQGLIRRANEKFSSKVTAKGPEENLGTLKPEEDIETDFDLIYPLMLVALANSSVLEKLIGNYIKNSSDLDRVTLRDRLAASGFPIFTASNAVYRLSTKLNALCSERALEEYNNNNQ